MAKKNESSLPNGFAPVGFSKVDGWYTVEPGNVLQGIMRGSFTVQTDLGKKKVFRVELTKGGTAVVNSEKEAGTLAVGDVCGIDQRGFLKPLDNVADGSEVYIKCTGRGTAKKGQSPPWTFDIGVKVAD